MALVQTGFGEKQKKLWRLFTSEVNGKIIDGGQYNPDSLIYKYKGWTVVLDEVIRMPSGGASGSLVTRFRIPIVNQQALSFKVHKEDLFMKFFKLFGTQDIQIGDPQFDKKFIIEGTNTDALRKVLSHRPLRESLLKIPDALLTLRTNEEKHGDDFPEGIDLLEIDLPGKVHAFDQLQTMHQVLTQTCEALTHFDPSFQLDPGVNFNLP